jgi:hypothetical protein
MLLLMMTMIDVKRNDTDERFSYPLIDQAAKNNNNDDDDDDDDDDHHHHEILC